MSFDLLISQGDLKIGPDGDLQKVRDSDKLIQDILKIALTPVGANPFFPWYGSNVARSLVGSPFNQSIAGPIASDQLRASLARIQVLQRGQFTNGQRMTPAEMLAAIREVRVERNQTDPRIFRVFIQVLSRALTTASTAFDVSL